MGRKKPKRTFQPKPPQKQGIGKWALAMLITIILFMVTRY